jgi:hypothetical protein
VLVRYGEMILLRHPSCPKSRHETADGHEVARLDEARRAKGIVA